MGLGIAAVNAWVTVAAENAFALQAKVSDELALANFKNELVYALGTRQMSYRGLEVGDNMQEQVDEPASGSLEGMMGATKETTQYIAMNGRPYALQADPDYIVQIYDGRGLLNFNFVQTTILQRFLGFFGATDTQLNQLPDTLGDWTDADDLARLSGAEKVDYQRLSRHLPSNAALLTPMEVQSAMGWDKLPSLWEADLKEPLLSTCPLSGFNPNTAPEMILLAYIPGMTKDTTAQVVKERAVHPFAGARDFMAAANVLLPNEAFFLSFIPGTCMVVDVTNRTTHEKTRFSLTLLRTSQGQPWQVDYVFHIPSQYRRETDVINPEVTFPTPEAIYSRQRGNNGTAGLQ
jgi:hypothetical protein